MGVGWGGLSGEIDGEGSGGDTERRGWAEE